MSLAYGIEVDEDNDPYIASVRLITQLLCAALIPGAYLVDFLPIRE